MRSQVEIASRVAVSAALLLGLAACTATSSGTPTSATTTGPPTALATDTANGNLSAFCAGLAAAASKITAAEIALYGSGANGGANASIAPLVTELSALRAGAPPQIQAALSELITGFTTAGQVLSHPTKDNEAQLVTLGPRLAADSQAISAYVISKCPAR